MQGSNGKKTQEISIHALREEGDVISLHNHLRQRFEISIHALREEGDLVIGSKVPLTGSISIHALREEGDKEERKRGRPKDISIHALREEGDRGRTTRPQSQCYFYPRPPRGGRPGGNGQGEPRKDISIHALREEGDARSIVGIVDSILISIHALREEGDFLTNAYDGVLKISIHALREEGDLDVAVIDFTSDISIHALREEGDQWFVGVGVWWDEFLSTPSARRATTLYCGDSASALTFLSTPSARRATGFLLFITIVALNFYPRPPRGGRHQPLILFGFTV